MMHLRRPRLVGRSSSAGVLSFLTSFPPLDKEKTRKMCQVLKSEDFLRCLQEKKSQNNVTCLVDWGKNKGQVTYCSYKKWREKIMSCLKN